jgi:hypothetical protein
LAKYFLETYQFQEASSETADQYHRKRKGLPFVFCSQAPVTLEVSFWQSIPLCSDGILYLEEYLCHFSHQISAD